jgi:hypothetical protein
MIPCYTDQCRPEGNVHLLSQMASFEEKTVEHSSDGGKRLDMKGTARGSVDVEIDMPLDLLDMSICPSVIAVCSLSHACVLHFYYIVAYIVMRPIGPCPELAPPSHEHRYQRSVHPSLRPYHDQHRPLLYLPLCDHRWQSLRHRVHFRGCVRQLHGRLGMLLCRKY